MHADLYSSKFPPRVLKHVDQGRSTLPQQTGGGTGRSDEGKLGRAGINDPDLGGEGRRQAILYQLQNGDFTLATVQKTGEGRFGR